jgi:outer membrane lipoprotein SlyB
LAIVGSLALTDLGGCATGGNMFSSAVDPKDVCGVQHRDFYDSQNYFMTAAAAGAVQGALTGAAMGAMFAWATGGNVGRGAAVGAGVGAAAGASAKYYEAKQKEAQDQAALSNSIYDDVRKAAGEYDHVSTTFAALKQCRFQHAALVKAEYKQGTLTYQQASDDLAEQRRRMTEEIALARKYGEKMADQDGSFHFAAGSLAKDDPAAQQALLNPPSKRVHHAPAPSPTNYTINTAANVRKEPDAKSERVAGLSAGSTVEPEGDPTNGWQKIKFNGETEGYVLAKFISSPSSGGHTAVASGKTGSKSPSTPTPAPETAPAETATPEPAEPSDNGDKKVAVANAAATISEKRESYDKSVASADSEGAVAFNLNDSSSG